MYHRRSIRSRAVTTGCTGHATVNTPNRRDLQICGQTHAHTHPRSAIGPTGITGCPPALNPPGHECFPWTETCPGGRDQPASLSLTRTHARARRDENAGMWRLVRFADRTRARGNRGLWEFEFKDNGYFYGISCCYSMVSYLNMKYFILYFSLFLY